MSHVPVEPLLIEKPKLESKSSLNCTEHTPFGPQRPLHKYVYILNKNTTNIFNYLIVRRDVEKCIIFTTPLCREIIEVTQRKTL